MSGSGPYGGGSQPAARVYLPYLRGLKSFIERKNVDKKQDMIYVMNKQIESEELCERVTSHQYQYQVEQRSYEERENIKELYINEEDLEGELDLSDFTKLEKIFISYYVDKNKLEIEDEEKYSKKKDSEKFIISKNIKLLDGPNAELYMLYSHVLKNELPKYIEKVKEEMGTRFIRFNQKFKEEKGESFGDYVVKKIANSDDFYLSPDRVWREIKDTKKEIQGKTLDIAPTIPLVLQGENKKKNNDGKKDMVNYMKPSIKKPSPLKLNTFNKTEKTGKELGESELPTSTENKRFFANNSKRMRALSDLTIVEEVEEEPITSAEEQKSSSTTPSPENNPQKLKKEQNKSFQISDITRSVTELGRRPTPEEVEKALLAAAEGKNNHSTLIINDCRNKIEELQNNLNQLDDKFRQSQANHQEQIAKNGELAQENENLQNELEEGLTDKKQKATQKIRELVQEQRNHKCPVLDNSELAATKTDRDKLRKREKAQNEKIISLEEELTEAERKLKNEEQ
ncbi:9701_t:CDS:2 [Ambispora gerdemannii]|uniref:9701_t:CDS:1 n=1 Tax=Ambispora gerdemannii TaxID=144530 RepID=A0A9N9ABU2_9GLOM|nr:9701_t:CDS:2 [Ambispora gerdemannii]